MKSTSLLAILCCLCARVATAQTTDAYTLSTGAAAYPAKIFDTDMGQNTWVGHSTYGIGLGDSTYINLAKLDEAFVAVTHAELRLPNPIARVVGVAYTGDSYVVSGMSLGNVETYPYLLKTDDNFNVTWAYKFPNLQHSQWGMGKVYDEAGRIIAFSTNGQNTTGFYRIQSTVDDTTFSSRVITPPIDTYVRVEEGFATGVEGEHIVCGEMADAIGQNGWLAKIDSTGVLWSYQYDFGGTVQENTYHAMHTTDGNIIATTISQSSTTELASYVSKVDTTGAMLWCKKVYIPSAIVYLVSAAETNDGEIILSGFNSGYQPLFVKLDAAGNFMWAHTWQLGGIAGISTTPYIQKPDGSFLYSRSAGDFLFLELDSEGNGCGFVDTPSLLVEDFATEGVRTSFPLSSAGFTPTRQSILAYPVQQTLQTTLVCTSTAVEEGKEESPVSIFPQPAHDAATIYLHENWGTEFMLKIVDISGREMRIENTGSRSAIPIDVSHYANGIYFAQLSPITGTQVKTRTLKFLVD